MDEFAGSVVQAAPLFELPMVEVEGYILVVELEKSPHEPFASLVEVKPQLPAHLSLN